MVSQRVYIKYNLKDFDVTQYTYFELLELAYRNNSLINQNGIDIPDHERNEALVAFAKEYGCNLIVSSKDIAEELKAEYSYEHIYSKWKIINYIGRLPLKKNIVDSEWGMFSSLFDFRHHYLRCKISVATGFIHAKFKEGMLDLINCESLQGNYSHAITEGYEYKQISVAFEYKRCEYYAEAYKYCDYYDFIFYQTKRFGVVDKKILFRVNIPNLEISSLWINKYFECNANIQLKWSHKMNRRGTLR